MSWFEVTARPRVQFEQLFENIQILFYAESDNDLIEKTKNYGYKECKFYLKDLFYKVYFEDFDNSFDHLDKMKVLVASMKMEISVEDQNLKQILARAFPEIFEIVSAKCVSSCEGCRNNYPDQRSHMDIGGCLKEK